MMTAKGRLRLPLRLFTRLPQPAKSYLQT